jgi:hypothetical protein
MKKRETEVIIRKMHRCTTVHSAIIAKERFSLSWTGVDMSCQERERNPTTESTYVGGTLEGRGGLLDGLLGDGLLDNNLLDRGLGSNLSNDLLDNNLLGNNLLGDNLGCDLCLGNNLGCDLCLGNNLGCGLGSTLGSSSGGLLGERAHICLLGGNRLGLNGGLDSGLDHLGTGLGRDLGGGLLSDRKGHGRSRERRGGGDKECKNSSGLHGEYERRDYEVPDFECVNGG